MSRGDALGSGPLNTLRGAAAMAEAQRVCLAWSSELQESSGWERLLREADSALPLPGRGPGLADVLEQLRAADSYLRALEVVASGFADCPRGPEARREWSRAVDVMTDAWLALPESLANAVTLEAERRGWIPKGTAANRKAATEGLALARAARR